MDFFSVRQRRSSGKVFSKRNDRRNSDVLREHAPPRFFVLKSLRYAVILFLNQKAEHKGAARKIQKASYANCAAVEMGSVVAQNVLTAPLFAALFGLPCDVAEVWFGIVAEPAKQCFKI